jgi:hypothetical protein
MPGLDERVAVDQARLRHHLVTPRLWRLVRGGLSGWLDTTVWFVTGVPLAGCCSSVLTAILRMMICPSDNSTRRRVTI